MENTKVHYKTCEICGIRSGRSDGQKRIFMAKFPLDEDRCKQWVKNTGKEDLVYIPIEKLHQLKHICGSHFLSKDFKKGKTQLRKNAIPSERLSAEPLADELLIGFPLHIAKIDQAELTSIVSKEHDYCASWTITPTPSTSTAEPVVEISRKRKMSLTTAPSTSSADLVIERPMEISETIEESCKSPELMLEITKKKKICSGTEPITTTARTKGRSTTSKTSPITPRKRKLLNKIRNNKVLIKCLKKKVTQIENISSPVLKSLIESTVRNEKRKPKGRRWSNLNKSVALALYKKSPKAYRYICQLLSMPSVRTLQTILENMKLEPGVDPCIVTHLKAKALKLKDEDKICVILFDEMALKSRLIYNVAGDKIDGYEDLGEEGGRSGKVANTALVFMLQGIRKKMKQPIAHYFVKGTISTEKLHVIIKTVIRSMTAAGYKIIATVCDQGPTNVGALNLLKKFSSLSVDSNYFLLDNEKVFIIFDVPHLFKSIRNNFLQAGDVVIDGKKAKWQHLINLEEKNRTTLHFKKITKAHVNPKYRSKMRVKLAAQILSNTVAAVLKLQSESLQNTLESKSILETAQVIEFLDRLFDSTNGPASIKDVKKKVRQNVSKTSFHHEVWPLYKDKLKTLQFLKSDSRIRLKNIRCVNGYIITISTLQDIWKFVESKNYKYLNLRQLNQDALENLFGCIRQHSPTNKNPTCHHFISALKSAILTRLSTPKSRGSNCEEDDNEILFDFQDIIFRNPQQEIQNNDSFRIGKQNESQCPILTDNEVYPIVHIPEAEIFDEDLEKVFKSFEKQPTVYVSGYLASVLLKNQTCEHCINSIKVLNPLPNSYYNYIALREWWSDKTCLTYPTLQLCQAIDNATTTFENEVKPVMYIKDLNKFAKTVMLASTNFFWMCQNHKNTMVDQLLGRLSHLLIRNECGTINRSFALGEENSADCAKKAQQLSIDK